MISDFEKKKIELEVKSLASKFKKPAECKDSELIRRYLGELSKMVEEYETQFHYVPTSLYTLLAQYNQAHTRILHTSFVNDYF
jgi:hypothetical protein